MFAAITHRQIADRAFAAHFLSARADFESILSLLSSYFIPEDEDALLRWIKRMLKRDDCRALIASAKVAGKEKRQ